MAQIVMSSGLIEEISNKVDTYLKCLFNNIAIDYNLNTIKRRYMITVTNEVLKNYNIRKQLAQKHADRLISNVIDYRVSLVNC